MLSVLRWLVDLLKPRACPAPMIPGRPVLTGVSADEIAKAADAAADDDDEVWLPFSGFSSVWTIPNAGAEISRKGAEYVWGGHRGGTLGGVLREAGVESPLPVFTGFVSSVMLTKLRALGVDTVSAVSTPLALRLRSKDSLVFVFDHHLATAATACLASVPEEALVTSDTERFVLGGAESFKKNFEALARWFASIPPDSQGLWCIDCIRCMSVASFVREHS